MITVDSLMVKYCISYVHVQCIIQIHVHCMIIIYFLYMQFPVGQQWSSRAQCQEPVQQGCPVDQDRGSSGDPGGGNHSTGHGQPQCLRVRPSLSCYSWVSVVGDNHYHTLACFIMPD